MATATAMATDCTWLLSGQLADDEPMRHIRLDTSPFVVGRRPESSLCIPNPTVSNMHAEITVGDGALIVRDLGSTNGTFVNGVRINEPFAAHHGDLVQFAQIVFRACIDAAEFTPKTVQNDSGDRALALIQFDKLMNERAVCPHFQPIVDIASADVLGYEVLGRSRLFGLTSPHSMFSAAAVLNMEGELSRIFREEGVRSGGGFSHEHLLFLNTHPAEIGDLDLLIFSLRELRELAPDRAIVLEIHEASATHRFQMAKLRSALTELNMGLAYDDFGAGQARLVELVDVPPDYLKFDMKLVQGLGTAPEGRQKMIARLVQMVLELGIRPLAEGIETADDHRICQLLGFTHAQGYLYGRPALPKDILEHGS